MNNLRLVIITTPAILFTACFLHPSVLHSLGLEPVVAQTCWAENCGPQKELQFTPGQKVTLKLTNQSSQAIQLEEVPRTRVYTLAPGQTFQKDFGGQSRQNLSVVFWEKSENMALWPRLSKPDDNTLQVDLHQGGPGRRSIYLLNDGRVAIN